MVSHAHAARLEPWVSVGVFPNDDGVGCVGRAAGCARPDGHPLQPGAARPCRVFPRRIAGARLVELPGLRSIYHWVDRRANEIALTETRRIADLAVREPTTERVLSTVLFTDLVGSTERAVEVGDEAESLEVSKSCLLRGRACEESHAANRRFSTTSPMRSCGSRGRDRVEPRELSLTCASVHECPPRRSS